MTLHQTLQWINPIAWIEITTDLGLARSWGEDDAQIPDPQSRETAQEHSLHLLHPITHRRYHKAYAAALKEDQ